MTFAVGRKGEIEIMPKFCIHEQHAGICVKTGSDCSEGVCLYEDMRDFIIADDTPIVRCQDCVYARPLKDVKYDYLCHYWNLHRRNQNQFCSQGKRKEDEK